VNDRGAYLRRKAVGRIQPERAPSKKRGMHRIARLIREDRGASAIEHTLIAVLIALVAIAVFQLVGPDLIFGVR
jgi:Flp pilus assembly pilin Flp